MNDLFVMDGYSSHCAGRFETYDQLHGIDVFGLPAHFSHISIDALARDVQNHVGVTEFLTKCQEFSSGGFQLFQHRGCFQGYQHTAMQPRGCECWTECEADH